MQHLEKIETDIVYLQDKMQQLNDIVAELQSSVTKLEKQNEFLARKVQELDVEARPDRRPPHY